MNDYRSKQAYIVPPSLHHSLILTDSLTRPVGAASLSTSVTHPVIYSPSLPSRVLCRAEAAAAATAVCRCPYRRQTNVCVRVNTQLAHKSSSCIWFCECYHPLLCCSTQVLFPPLNISRQLHMKLQLH